MCVAVWWAKFVAVTSFDAVCPRVFLKIQNNTIKVQVPLAREVAIQKFQLPEIPDPIYLK